MQVNDEMFLELMKMCEKEMIEDVKKECGDDGRLASSGDDSRLASSGYNSRLASSGNYSRLASSGNYSRLASSGNYSRLASSGYNSRLASSGDDSKLASSGDNSRLASSGNYSRLASSGDDSKLASSGDDSRLASSGDDSRLASSGSHSRLEITGNNSVASCVGYFSRISGIHGSLISAVSYIYENKKYIPKSFCNGIVGENGIKENQLYIGYSEKLIEYAEIDGIACGIISKKGNVYKIVLQGRLEIAYFIENNGVFSHGKTIKEARESLIYKIKDRDTSKYNDWKLTDIKTKAELIESYRVITGACEFGTKNFCENKKLPNECTVNEAIEIIGNSWGIETYINFFKGGKL